VVVESDNGEVTLSCDRVKGYQMGRMRNYFEDLTARKCCVCGTRLVDGETFYVEFPNDLYCKRCAKQHPDYGR
jgi:hypothetical protein